jgi:hypothetical protein
LPPSPRCTRAASTRSWADFHTTIWTFLFLLT